MTYDKEREFFLEQFAREFPSAPVSVATGLLRCATTSQRASEAWCSFEMSDAETKRLAKREKAADERAEKLARQAGTHLIHGSGDPRGFPYLLHCPSGRTYDWGQRGLGVPGRPYPARVYG